MAPQASASAPQGRAELASPLAAPGQIPLEALVTDHLLTPKPLDCCHARERGHPESRAGGAVGGEVAISVALGRLDPRVRGGDKDGRHHDVGEVGSYDRLEMALQALEKPESAPGNGMAPAADQPPSPACGAPAEGPPALETPLIDRLEMAPQALENPDFAPGNGIAPERSNPQDVASGRDEVFASWFDALAQDPPALEQPLTDRLEKAPQAFEKVQFAPENGAGSARASEACSVGPTGSPSGHRPPNVRALLNGVAAFWSFDKLRMRRSLIGRLAAQPPVASIDTLRLAPCYQAPLGRVWAIDRRMDVLLFRALGLLGLAILVALAARRLRLPYTVGLVLAGAALALFRVNAGLALTHDLIFNVVLPPLLFEAALKLRWNELRRDLVPVVALATIGVAVCAAVVAAGLLYLLGWDSSPRWCSARSSQRPTRSR